MTTSTKTIHELTAADLMTHHPVRIREDAFVQEAAEMLAKYGVSGLPVVDALGKCVGVFSNTDLVRSANHATAKVIVCNDPFYRLEERANFPEEPVRNWMTQDVVSVEPETAIDKIAEMMLDARIHRVIVVNESLHPEGIIASTDLLAAIVRTKS